MSALTHSISRVLTYVKEAPMLKLTACLIFDFIGCMSYLLPFLGEAFDLQFAPIFAVFLQFMFGSWVVSLIGFLEELLPGTDFIPTATIAYCLENMESQRSIAEFLGIRRRNTARTHAS
jgi:hypothetical protein